MRLTLINQFYAPDPSPTAQFAASLCERRAAAGDTVTVLAGKGGYVGSDTLSHSAAAQSVDVRRFWTPALGKARHLFRIADYASYHSPAALRLQLMPAQDVIIAMTTPPFIALAALAHKAMHPATKVILWCMDCYPQVAERTGLFPPGRPVAETLHVLNEQLFDRLDHLVTLDTAMERLLLDAYAPHGKLAHTIIPNWERTSLFPAAPQRAPRTEGEELVVLYLGNMGYGHDVETALDAAEALQGRNVRFRFVGGGKRWQSVKDEVAERGLSNVTVEPYVPKEQTPEILAAAHVALITLREDMLGVMSPSKLHSNLATGLPVAYVGPEGSNVDDAIRDHGCGVSLREGQTDELVGWLMSLSNYQPRYEELSAAARSAFDEAYCDTASLAKWDEVLAAL